MATRLNPASLSRAIDHLCKFGDTDVFPHLVELAFLAANKEAVIAELAALDPDRAPRGARVQQQAFDCAGARPGPAPPGWMEGGRAGRDRIQPRCLVECRAR
jgi:hypothetical protein